jgi:hypothetical protein
VRAAELVRDIEALCAAHPRLLTVPPITIDLQRAITSAQRGEHALTEAALERAVRRSRELSQHELAWHAERFTLLFRMNTGSGARVEHTQTLRQLHRRAEREALARTECFIAYDEAVLLNAPEQAQLAADGGALKPALDDAPNVWSLKIRALVASGRHSSARLSLQRIDPQALEKLPRDRDYLGTLGALARAAMALDEPAYVAVLERLLAPYTDYFAVGLTFHSEGSVDELVRALRGQLQRKR